MKVLEQKINEVEAQNANLEKGRYSHLKIWGLCLLCFDLGLKPIILMGFATLLFLSCCHHVTVKLILGTGSVRLDPYYLSSVFS